MNKLLTQDDMAEWLEILGTPPKMRCKCGLPVPNEIFEVFLLGGDVTCPQCNQTNQFTEYEFNPGYFSVSKGVPLPRLEDYWNESFEGFVHKVSPTPLSLLPAPSSDDILKHLLPMLGAALLSRIR